jgi:hypothetical protein
MEALDGRERPIAGGREPTGEKVDRVLRQAANLVRIGRQGQVVRCHVVYGALAYSACQ